MSETLSLVCVECREEITIGKIGPEEPPSFWETGPFLDRQWPEVAYFLIVHRGHALGAIGSGWVDRFSPDRDPFHLTISLDALHDLHPSTGLIDAEEVSVPSELLKSLLSSKDP